MADNFKTVHDLLPKLLGQVSKEARSVWQLRPVWEEVVGKRFALRTRPIGWDNGKLVIGTSQLEPEWARILERRSPQLTSRLEEMLGKGTIKGLVFQNCPAL